VNYSDDEPLRADQADEAARARWQILHPVLPDDEFDDTFDAAEPPPVPAAQRMSWWLSALAYSREHVVVVVVALAVGVVFAVMTYQHSRPEALPAVPPVSVAMEPSPTPTPQPILKVHVLGAVAHPGVVTLPEGARVEDAIAAAGGLTGDADPALLNLAAVVTDGSQIIIGTVGNPSGEVNGGAATGGSTGSSSSGTGVKVNINTASETELETLPGIGPVTAGKIIAYRTDHGKFSTVDELQEVSGIGPKTMAQLEPYVTV